MYLCVISARQVYFHELLVTQYWISAIYKMHNQSADTINAINLLDIYV